LFIDEKESLKYWLERELLNRAIYSGYVNVDDYQKKIHDIQLEIFNKEKNLRKSKASKDDYYEFAVWASESEQSLIDSYQDVIENVRNGSIKMKGLWKKKTKKLLLNQTTFNIKK
ncbi:MAG: hypothetical protein PHO86_04995, partial [Bacilli bacterium]|nr:hypothetical protein [Bacilli bacterium]